MAEPGTDRPKHPRPKEIDFTDGTSAWKTGCEPIAVNDILFAYVGDDNEYGDYNELDPGTYTTSEVEITVGAHGRVLNVE